MSWHPDPGSGAADSLQYSWRNLYGYAFSPFCLIGRILARKVREYQNSLLHLSQIAEDQGQYLITLRPGESWLAIVMNERLIPFQVI